MKYVLFLIFCIGVMFYQSHIHAQEKNELIAYYEGKIQSVMQETSDELMRACDDKIDEILSQF